MHADCEYCIKRDICTRDVPKPCRYKYTEEERIADQASDNCGTILSAMYLPKTYQKEEDKMKATSKQEIKNIRDISFSFLSCPIEMNSTLTITATTDDDTFEFVFEGEHIIQSCEKAGFFISLEKDQKIRELEKENKELKAKSKDISDDNVLLLATNNKLKEEKEKLEEINKNLKKHVQYHIDNKDNIIKRKDELSKENYELKKRYDCLNRKFNRAILNRMSTTIEYFADEEPSSRRDILRCAEKCVCGHREQDYGTPESNFKTIADLWNDYLGLAENGDGVPIFSIKNITTTDVAMMMALLKIARIRNGGGSGDSFVDLAGYAACGGEIWAGQKHQKDQN